MAVIGSSTNLPGDIVTPPYAPVCDTHPSVKAVASIIGETDSLGSETREVCQECLNKYKEQVEQDKLDPTTYTDCDNCGVSDATVKPARDPEEGTCGPVYYWCRRCATAVFSRFQN